MKIGILSLQGAVIEHIAQIEKLGHQAIEIKYAKQLDEIDAIILPGGESTTMGKLLVITDLLTPLKTKIENGLPVWGTCAGLILLAKEIDNDHRRHLSLMDITVKRNAYGTQIDSFATDLTIEQISPNPIRLVFIRAPYISEVKENVEVIATVDGNIVAARQNNMFVTSFHPELTEQTTVLEYFINKICTK